MKLKPYALFNQAAETSSGGGMNAGQLAGFSSAETDTADTAGNDQTPEFGEFMASFGAKAETPGTEQVQDPPAGDEAAKTEGPPAFAFDKWWADKFPENPDPTKIAKVEDWKGMRTTLNTALKDVQVLSAEKIALEQRLAASDKSQALPESEAVSKLTGDLEASKLALEQLRQQHETELVEYRNFKAGQDLAANPAFRAEYDGKRANLKEEIEGVLKEAGLDTALVENVLGAKSLLQMAKALEGVEDSTARRLIEDRAKQFHELTTKREAAMKGNPFEELTKWQEYESQRAGMFATRFRDGLQQKLMAVVPTVAQELSSEKGDIFFRTPAGQMALQEIGQRFERGYDLTEQEVTAHMAKSAGFEFYASMAKELATKVADLEKQLSRFGNMDPAQSGAGAAKAVSGGGFDVAGLFNAIGHG